MSMQLPVLGALVDWACGVGDSAPDVTLEQLEQDKTEAKAKICAVMEGLAHKHGLPLQQIDPQTLGFVDEALDVLMSDREDELQAELENDFQFAREEEEEGDADRREY